MRESGLLRSWTPVLLLTVAHAAAVPAAAPEATGELFRWLDRRGGVTEGVRCATSPAGVRGLYCAAAEVRIGDVLLEVPLSATLCDRDDAIALDALPGAAPTWAADLPWNTQLALALLRERDDNEASAWAPFLASFPRFSECGPDPLLPKNLDADFLAEARADGWS